MLNAGALAQTSNPIQVENALQGTFDWQIPQGNYLDRKIEGYASHTSVNLGETIHFYINVDVAQYVDLEIYRLGYYNGAGARLIRTIRGAGTYVLPNRSQYPILHTVRQSVIGRQTLIGSGRFRQMR